MKSYTVTKPEDLKLAVRVEITLGDEQLENFDGPTLIEERTGEGCDTCGKEGDGWVIEFDPAGSLCDTHLFEYYTKKDNGSIVILATGLKCSMCEHLEESQDGLERHEGFAHSAKAQALDEAINQAVGGLAAAADLSNRGHFLKASEVLREHLEVAAEFMGGLLKEEVKPKDPDRGESTA